MIETATESKRTNLGKLSRKLGVELDETGLQSAFASLDGKIERAQPRKARHAFMSAQLGTVEPDAYELWTGEPLGVPVFSDRALSVLLVDIEASDAAGIDRAVASFLDRAPENRAAGSRPALENGRSFAHLVGRCDSVARQMGAMTDPEDIWQFVSPSGIEIVRREEGDEPDLSWFSSATANGTRNMAFSSSIATASR